MVESEDEEQTTAAKCEIYIGKTPISAVVDSGAATSIITKAMLDQLGLNIDQPSNMIIVTANGTRIRTLGIVQSLPINIKHMIIRTPVQVLESKDKVLLLGNDWLRKVHANIDWKKEQLSIFHKGRTVTIPVAFTKNTVEQLSESEEEEEEAYVDEYEEELLLESEGYYLSSSDE